MKPPLMTGLIQPFLGRESALSGPFTNETGPVETNRQTLFGTAIALSSWSMKKVLKQKEEKKVVQALFSEWSRKTYKKLGILF